MTAKGARCVAVLQTKVLRYRLFQMMCSTICRKSKFEGVVWRDHSFSISDPQNRLFRYGESFRESARAH